MKIGECAVCGRAFFPADAGWESVCCSIECALRHRVSDKLKRELTELKAARDRARRQNIIAARERQFREHGGGSVTRRVEVRDGRRMIIEERR